MIPRAEAHRFKVLRAQNRECRKPQAAGRREGVSHPAPLSRRNLHARPQGRCVRARRSPCPFQLQAAIAALHGLALLQFTPTPWVELNAAAALATQPSQGLEWLDSLQRRGLLQDQHRFHALPAELLLRSGEPAAARAAWTQSLRWRTNGAERRFLEKRLRDVGPALLRQGKIDALE